MQTLNAHSKISFALDPYLGLFKACRNDIVASQVNLEQFIGFSPDHPLSDYHFDEVHANVLEAIWASDLELPHTLDLSSLLRGMIPRADLDNKDLTPFFETDISGTTYKDLLASSTELVRKARGKNSVWYGFHENWTAEFFPALAKAFPSARFLIVLRDPRAVQASHCAADPSLRSSLLSYCRGLRKLMSCAAHYLADPLFSGRLMVATYESLVRNPESIARDTCSFLCVPFEAGMMDPQMHLDPGGSSLRDGVSSFEHHVTGYEPYRIDRWRTRIPPEVLSLTQNFLRDDMLPWGYIAEESNLDIAIAHRTLSADNETPKKWRTDSPDVDLELSHELLRREFLHWHGNAAIDPVVARKYFLSDTVYSHLRASMREGFVPPSGPWFA
jgi:hypothetical protein